MKEFVGIKPDEEHVVESPQDKDVEKQKVWIGVLQAELANCTNAVKTLQTARETAADDVEGLSSDLSHVLEEARVVAARRARAHFVSPSGAPRMWCVVVVLPVARRGRPPRLRQAMGCSERSGSTKDEKRSSIRGSRALGGFARALGLARRHGGGMF